MRYPGRREFDDDGRPLCSCGRLAVRTIRGEGGEELRTCISEEVGRQAVAEYLAQFPQYAALARFLDTGGSGAR
jgi:hypothetical protein